MSKQQITIWKNNRDTSLAGKSFDLFRVSWSDEESHWVRDENGPYWGYVRPDENIGAMRNPKKFGKVETILDEEDNEIIERGIDHLVAEDLIITPPELSIRDHKPGIPKRFLNEIESGETITFDWTYEGPDPGEGEDG